MIHIYATWPKEPKDVFISGTARYISDCTLAKSFDCAIPGQHTLGTTTKNEGIDNPKYGLYRSDTMLYPIESKALGANGNPC